ERGPTVTYVGIDVHVKTSQICEVNAEDEVVWERQIPTTDAKLREVFGSREGLRIVMESGGSTPWIRRVLQELGHEVVVVNPRQIRLVAESTLKCDRIDARILAQLASAKSSWLRPVYQRSVEGEALRTWLRARSGLVKTRTSLINLVRGLLRSQGFRPGACSTDRFVERISTMELPVDLRWTCDLILPVLVEVYQQIQAADAKVRELTRNDEVSQRLQTIPGVGPLISLAFIAWMDRADRFDSSRNVGAALGLRPWVRSSGPRQRHGRITKQGDGEMRRLLVQAALGALRSRQESALRRWAQHLAARCGPKKARVALARKIGVLMHRLWVSGESFQPFPKSA
ncbi:MAG: IS110 family transposase, partial [Acidobacteriota bacterium]